MERSFKKRSLSKRLSGRLSSGKSLHSLKAKFKSFLSDHNRVGDISSKSSESDIDKRKFSSPPGRRAKISKGSTSSSSSDSEDGSQSKPKRRKSDSSSASSSQKNEEKRKSDSSSVFSSEKDRASSAKKVMKSDSGSDPSSQKEKKASPSLRKRKKKKKKKKKSDSSSDASSEKEKEKSPSWKTVSTKKKKSDSSSDSSSEKIKEAPSKPSRKTLQLPPRYGHGQPHKLPPLEEALSSQGYGRHSSATQSDMPRSKLLNYSSLPTSPADLSHNFNVSYRGGDSSPVALVHSLSQEVSGRYVNQPSEISFASPPSSSYLGHDVVGGNLYEKPTSPFRKIAQKLKRLGSAYYDEEQGACRCRRCGWIYPVQNPSGRHRREHKQHCGELINVQQWLGLDEVDGDDVQSATEQGIEESRGGLELLEKSTLQETLDTAHKHSMATRDDEGVPDVSNDHDEILDHGESDETLSSVSGDHHGVKHQSNVDHDENEGQSKLEGVSEESNNHHEVQNQSKLESLSNRSTHHRDTEDQTRLEGVSSGSPDSQGVEDQSNADHGENEGQSKLEGVAEESNNHHEVQNQSKLESPSNHHDIEEQTSLESVSSGSPDFHGVEDQSNADHGENDAQSKLEGVAEESNNHHEVQNQSKLESPSNRHDIEEQTSLGSVFSESPDFHGLEDQSNADHGEIECQSSSEGMSGESVNHFEVQDNSKKEDQSNLESVSSGSHDHDGEQQHSKLDDIVETSLVVRDPTKVVLETTPEVEREQKTCVKPEEDISEKVTYDNGAPQVLGEVGEGQETQTNQKPQEVIGEEVKLQNHKDIEIEEHDSVETGEDGKDVEGPNHNKQYDVGSRLEGRDDGVPEITSPEHFQHEASTSSSTHVVEYDIEQVVRKQETHDLICPVCGSCVTKRVILRKRKRTLGQGDARSPKSREIKSGAHGQEPPTDDSETWGCLACLSLFIRRVGGGRQKSGAEGVPSERVDEKRESVPCLPLIFPPFRWGPGRSEPDLVEPLLPKSAGVVDGADSAEITPVLSNAADGDDSSRNCLPDIWPDVSWGTSFPRHELPPSVAEEIKRKRRQLSATKTAYPVPATQDPNSGEGPPQGSSFNCLPDLQPDLSWGTSFPTLELPASVAEEIKRKRTQSSTKKTADVEQSVFDNDEIIVVPVTRDPRPVKGDNSSCNCLPDIWPDVPWGTSFPRHELPPSVAEVIKRKRRPLSATKTDHLVPATRDPNSGEGPPDRSSFNCLPDLQLDLSWGTSFPRHELPASVVGEINRKRRLSTLPQITGPLSLPVPPVADLATSSDDSSHHTIVSQDIHVEGSMTVETGIATKVKPSPGAAGVVDSVQTHNDRYHFKTDVHDGKVSHTIDREPKSLAPDGRSSSEIHNDTPEDEPSRKKSVSQNDFGGVSRLSWFTGRWWWPSMEDKAEAEVHEPLLHSAEEIHHSDRCRCLPTLPAFSFTDLFRDDLLAPATEGETVVAIHSDDAHVQVLGDTVQGTADHAIDLAQDQQDGIQTTEGREYLKSIVHGGLDVTLVSLGVVSSGAGSDAKTITVLAIGLSSLFFGIITYFNTIMSLYSNHLAQFHKEVGKSLLLNGFLALVSFVFFGALAPITYAFSFRHTMNRDYKFVSTCGVALVSIVLLGAANAHVKSKSTYKVISKLVTTGFAAAIVGYQAGNYLAQLLERFGFDSV